MAYCDDARVYWRQVRHMSDDSNNGETEFNHLTDYTVQWRKDTVDSASNGATTNSPMFRVPYAARVISAYWIQEAATTANSTAYYTMTLRKNNGSASTMLDVGSFKTQTTTLAAYTARSLSLTASNCALVSGACLFVGVAKTSGGKKLQEGVLSVVLRRV